MFGPHSCALVPGNLTQGIMHKMAYSPKRVLPEEGKGNSGLSHLPPLRLLWDLGERCASSRFGGSSPLSAGSAGCCGALSGRDPRRGTAAASSWPPPSPVGSGAQRCAGSVPSLWPKTHVC